MLRIVHERREKLHGTIRSTVAFGSLLLSWLEYNGFSC
jgi:hypothetical protein